MFQPIAISLSPNTEKDDVFLALKLIFSPWQWKKGKEIEKLEKDFARYLKVKHAVSFGSGRAAEYAILKSLGIKKGDQVLIQAFTCVVVPNSILWLDAEPVYVDIDPRTFNINPDDLEKKITSSSKAIIVQHTFGQPAALEKILKIAQNRNLLVIEDCAHSLGAKFKGKHLGTFGKAGFFSFGRDKVISSVFGGMAATNDDQLAQKLRDYQNSLCFPSYFWIFQQILHPVVFNFLVLPFYHFFGLGKLALFIFQKLNLLSFPVGKKEKMAEKPQVFPLRLPNTLAHLALNQLKKVDRFKQKRNKIAQLYSRKLKNLLLDLPKIKKGSVVFRYSLKTKHSKELYQFAKIRGVLLGRWYANVIDPQGVDFDKIKYKKGSCPVAERTAPKVINLPTYPRMDKKEDALKIIGLIKEYFRKKEGESKQAIAY